MGSGFDAGVVGPGRTRGPGRGIPAGSGGAPDGAGCSHGTWLGIAPPFFRAFTPRPAFHE
jgi:hypothetical protein